MSNAPAEQPVEQPARTIGGPDDGAHYLHQPSPVNDPRDPRVHRWTTPAAALNTAGRGRARSTLKKLVSRNSR